MKKIRCYFKSIYEENEKIWFVSQELVFCLFQMDKVSGELQCLGILPVDYGKQEAYSAIGKINNRIIIAPYYCTGDFIEFDLCSYQFKKIPLKHDIYSGKGTFNQVVKYNNTLLFIGCANGVIVEVNDSSQYIYHFKWAEQIGHQIANKLFFAKCVYVDGIMYLPVFNSNKIVELNLNNYKCGITVLPIEYNIISQFYDGKMFWYLPVEGNRIITYRKNKKEVEQIVIPMNPQGEDIFKTILFNEDETIVIMNDDNICFSISSAGQVFEQRTEVAGMIGQGKIVQTCLNINDMSYSQNIYFLCEHVLVEKNKYGVKTYAVDVDYEEICKMDVFKNIDWEKGKKYENNGKSLDSFIGFCTKSQRNLGRQRQCGEKIYREMLL